MIKSVLSLAVLVAAFFMSSAAQAYYPQFAQRYYNPYYHSYYNPYRSYESYPSYYRGRGYSGYGYRPAPHYAPYNARVLHYDWSWGGGNRGYLGGRGGGWGGEW